jgi:hypothetical protein
MPQDWQSFYESPAIDERIAQAAFQSDHHVAGFGIPATVYYRFGPELPL